MSRRALRGYALLSVLVLASVLASLLALGLSVVHQVHRQNRRDAGELRERAARLAASYRP